MIQWFLLIVITGCVIFHIATRYNRRSRLLSKIPGPTAYPLIGNLLILNTNCLHKFFKAGEKVCKQFYPLTRFWLCTTAIVSVSHPDDLEILLSSQKVIEKGYMYEYFEPWLKTGLLNSTDEKWRQRRKMLTPAFHFSVLKNYMEITNEEAHKCIEYLKAQGKESVQNLPSFCSKYTLKIICESAMGVNLDDIDPKMVDKYKQAVVAFGDIFLYRMPRPYIASWMIPYISKIGKLQQNALKVLHEFTDKVINNRKDYHRRTNNKYLNDMETEDKSSDNLSGADVGKRKRLAMLDLLLLAQQKGLIDDAGIREEVDTFTFEGHDTTGLALTYILWLFAENQPEQELARAEVTKLLDRTGRKLDITNTGELNYLERCIKESLRLFPPVETIMRYTREDLQLKHALIPANTNVLLHPIFTHRDPNFWPEPDKFDPDRFLPERSRGRHLFAYIPFSAGPRNCIGIKFAMNEMKSIVAQILYDFTLEPIDRIADVKLTAAMVLRPLHSARIRFVKIEKY